MGQGKADTEDAAGEASGEPVREGGKDMRGYYTAGGYYGRVNGRYMLFSSESDYWEYLGQEDAGENGG